MPLDLLIGREQVRILAPRVALDAVRERYGLFGVDPPPRGSGRPPIVLRIGTRPGRFSPAYERPVEVTTRLSPRGAIVFGGGARGRYDPATRQGAVDDATGLGAVDVLVRTALSVALPLSGSLLLHGAALPIGENGVALCGDSGTGKSTAAAAFKGASDEMLVLRPTEDGIDLESTPYWAGRPLRLPCAGVFCLERGGRPGFRRLSGGSIVRFLARHVVRYVGEDRTDHAILALLGAIAARCVVSLVSCPDGEAFLPFLGERLGLRRDVA